MLLVWLTLFFHVTHAFNYQHNPKKLYNIDDVNFHFQTFKKTYNRTYESHDEEMERFEIFKKKLVTINEVNKKDSSGVFGINQFTDISAEEFAVKYSGLAEFGGSSPYCTTITDKDLNHDAPAQFDWRDQIQMKVKNQLDCTACWAFAATANVEAQYVIRYKQTELFSEQQILDCAGSDGCADGIPAQALRYLIQVGGQEPEDVYPYDNKKGVCKFTPGKARVRVKDCFSFSLANEEYIKQALIQYGPVAAGVDSTTLMDYEGGVIRDCVYTKLNHAVLIVGYGTDSYGIDFWVIKNSWGAEWGEQGYARIRRRVNACGINNLHLCSSTIV